MPLTVCTCISTKLKTPSKIYTSKNLWSEFYLLPNAAQNVFDWLQLRIEYYHDSLPPKIAPSLFLSCLIVICFILYVMNIMYPCSQTFPGFDDFQYANTASDQKWMVRRSGNEARHPVPVNGRWPVASYCQHAEISNSAKG